MGLCAAVCILSARNLQRHPSELIQMGVGAENDNDNALKMALGDDGDVEAEVEEMTEEAVEEAMHETQDGVDEEINNALADGEASGKAGYEADIAKYKGQEADMGHSGWIQSWANPMRQAGLPANGLAKLAAKLQSLAQQPPSHQTVSTNSGPPLAL
eukprot:CAMPEP_0173082924 /NCGR_PEP_ID=MMETSP1102-20130122/18906_1 /TAXON_ID=49646 /ORGANISM="Geminigera sp., Strain Caron Lab Isolate" /LENGTH=156 /DNA_ID=CAMNT_0013959285 /DNA_START=62 /DNA_END=532 /DNA_ORIENTATION=+